MNWFPYIFNSRILGIYSNYRNDLLEYEYYTDQMTKKKREIWIGMCERGRENSILFYTGLVSCCCCCCCCSMKIVHTSNTECVRPTTDRVLGWIGCKNGQTVKRSIQAKPTTMKTSWIFNQSFMPAHYLHNLHTVHSKSGSRNNATDTTLAHTHTRACIRTHIQRQVYFSSE